LATFAVILPAAGKSSRFHDKNYKKPFAPLANRPVWLHSAERFVNRDDVKQTLLIISPDDREYFQNKFAGNAALLGIETLEGGAERADSIERALARVRPDIDFICVHDAARPCLAEDWVNTIFAAAERTGAAIFAIRVSGTLKRMKADHTIEETVGRDRLWEAQTPQVFRRDWILDAHTRRAALGPDITDDAQLIEAAGHAVFLVTGSSSNIKITTKEDVALAAAILKSRPEPKGSRQIHPFDDEVRW
jgi:2-C-methyl-D-erythritol 4-phosphate cytidylyltransferase